MPGRRPKLYPCLLCLDNPTRAGNSIYFECRCGSRLVLKDGELRETRQYSQREAVEKVEAGIRCTADEYEKLAS